METAFNGGYFPPDLVLGMETGWTLTEIRELDPTIKRMYLEFMRCKQDKEKEELEAMVNDAKGGSGSFADTPKNIAFVNEAEFVSKI